jgi:DNA-binding GntR family transcriptional regulator
MAAGLPATTLGSVPRELQTPSERVAADLTRRLESGEWVSGQALPSVRELCAHYGVARQTMTRALAVLASSGLVVTRERWGTFRA